jgi:predicted secreted protein
MERLRVGKVGGLMLIKPTPLVIAGILALPVAALLQYERVAPVGNVLAAAIYFIVWWICLFAVLPIGIRTQYDSGEVIQGTSAGAPVNPRFGFVVALNTIVATVVFAVLLVALRLNWVPLR